MILGGAISPAQSTPDASSEVRTGAAPESTPTAPALAPANPLPEAPAAPLPEAPAAAPTSPAASSSAQPAASAPPTREQQREDAERQLKIEEKQRLLGVMPQFQVVENGQAAPLTGKQKWRLAAHSAIDPFYIAWAFVIGGGWGEVVDSNKGYGWGDAGYFKRVGASYADNVDGALIGNALLPQLLHQDPRYFRKGTGSFASRFLYAAESTVVCRGDNGHTQANVSNVLGNFLAGAVSNAYYPADQRGVKLTIENGIDVTLFGALGGQLLEFGPDIQRMLHHHRQPKTATPTPLPAPTPAPAPVP